MDSTHGVFPCAALAAAVACGGAPPPEANSAPPASSISAPPPDSSAAEATADDDGMEQAAPDVPMTYPGGSYSIRGALERFKSKDANPEQILRIVGFIGKTNLADMPKCAVHPGNKASPPDCKAPNPTFWLCDSRTAPAAQCLRVMGWASNAAQLHDAIKAYKNDPNAPEWLDSFFGISIPKPIPAAGGKAIVRARHTNRYTKSIKGVVVDAERGILTFEGLKWIEKPDKPAKLPGM